MRRVQQLHKGESSAQRTLVAALWALLACALVAEFSGLWRAPQCPSRPAAGGTAAAAAAGSNDSSAAQAAAGPSWQEYDALLSQPAGRHGRQVKPKGGVPANLPLLLIHMTNKNPELHGVPVGMGPALFRWFAFAHTFNKSAGQSNAQLQSPVPPCHFYVDHRYRLLYIRNTKTAGTSISSTLGMKENPLACKAGRETCYAKCQGKQVCMEYLWDPDQLRKAFTEYTVFTFVRNPWSRAISTWFHIHNYALKQPCQDRFHKFAELPSAYGAKCLAHQGGCCKKRFGWVLEHIEPQSRCLFSGEGQPVADFIGRVEHADEDMQALLELINSRRPMGTEALSVPALPRMMVAEDSLASKQDLRRQKYAELYMNNDALADVRRYFHSDFKLLQFNDSIPWEDSPAGSSSDRGSGSGTAGGTASIVSSADPSSTGVSTGSSNSTGGSGSTAEAQAAPQQGAQPQVADPREQATQ